MAKIINPNNDPSGGFGAFSTNDRKVAIQELWKKGILHWKLNVVQKKMYDSFMGNKHKLTVFNTARRMGKSSILFLIAFEHCLKTPNINVLFVCPGKEWAARISRDIIPWIVDDAPKIYKPEYSTQAKCYEFNNGSKIYIAGSDMGGSDSIRGLKSSLNIIDEAGFVDNLSYLFKSVLMPATSTTKGRTLMASTPPTQANHDFVNYAMIAQDAGSYSKYTIWDNVLIDEDEKMEMVKIYGGINALEFRREWLAEFLTDTTRAVIPEFEEKKEEIVFDEKDFEMGTQIVPYIGMDIGFQRDPTAILFTYFDFNRQCLIVQDEWVGKYQDATYDKIKDVLVTKEQEIFRGLKVRNRISDHDARLVYDLQTKHQISIRPAEKFNKDAGLATLRQYIRDNKILINSKCTKLISQLNYGIWNKNRTSFDRTPHNAEVMGHLDLVDALLYISREINWNEMPRDTLAKNPNRFDDGYHYTYNGANSKIFLPTDSSVITAIKSIFFKK